MRHRLAKITVLALLSMTAVLVIVGAAFFWRLSQGPVSLDFMTETIEAQINKSLGGVTVKVGSAIFELDAKTNIPHFRLRDVVLLNQTGDLIAKSKKAAISFDGRSMFIGLLVPRSLDLIGARILIKRQLDGSVSLGFGSPPAAEDAVVSLDEQAVNGDLAKADREANTSAIPETTAKSLIDILSGQAAGSMASSIADIRISGASIELFDEANQSNWFAPEADLTFKKMPFGFTVFAKASVASGPTTWTADVSANYKTDSRTFAISARIEDLVPANVSDKIFALAQFARVNIPLSGRAEVEITDEGVMNKASAEFAASAGVVSLPEYIAQPIIIDEGALRVDYDVVTGGFKIVDSIILIGGSRAELTGRVDPIRAKDGRLMDFKIDIKATNVSVDTQGTVKNPVLVDKVEFTGQASVEGAELEIMDFVVMSGNAGVRLRGKITGGDESAGIQLAGRVRGISADFLKKLWPPIVAPKSREWVAENIQAGRMSDGVFSVSIPVNGVAGAIRNKIMPNEDIDFQFSLEDVNSNYFKTLPTLVHASGTAHLRGDSFDLNIAKGQVIMPSQGIVQVRDTTFSVTNLLADEVPGALEINLAASAPVLLELAGQPSLDLFQKSGIKVPNLNGNAIASIDLALPLIKDVPRERVTARMAVNITDASILQVVPNVDFTDGSLALQIDRKGITAMGPLKINGFPATISWSRASGDGAKATATLVTELDDDGREKLGIKLGTYLQGPAKITADITGLGEKTQSMKVTADLGRSEMAISSINWYRPPTKNTTASFSYENNGDAGRKIDNLIVKGPELSIKGDILLNETGGLKSATLSQVKLSDENDFTLKVTPGDNGQSIEVNGSSFDARPLVASIFSRSAGASTGDDPSQSMNVVANLDRVIAQRGEVLAGVTANLTINRNKLAEAEIQGKFLSGLPIAVHVHPIDGGRQLQINSSDGGAALRAANLYSKVAGGELEFSASMASGSDSTIQKGQLTLRDFAVRNEAALASIDSRGKAKKSGPRPEGLNFTKLKLPFTTDAKFIRIGNTLLKGNDLGATVDKGLIRKSDGAIDITGTIIPAYGLNSALSNIPLVGDILAGGKGQGIFGLTYAMGGTFEHPKFQVNPVSAIAPGILRRFFEFDAVGQPPKQRVNESHN